MLIEWNRKTAEDCVTEETVALLCVGSCEQHSDYLPTGTDALLVEKIAEIAAEKAQRNVLLLPAIRYGYSPHHRAFPGCITLRHETLTAIVVDVCMSAHRCGCKDIMILSGHGGNQTALQTAVNELGAIHNISVITLRYWDVSSSFISSIRNSDAGGMGHAGEFETSMMLWFYPELVKTSNIDERPCARGNEWHSPDLLAGNKIYRYVPFEKYSEKGNIGQAFLATAEKGKIMSQQITSDLARLIDTGLESFRL